MNQILSVEQAKSKRRKNKTSIHSILVIFSIFLIIFGIGLTSTGAYSYYANSSSSENNNKSISATASKPLITIEIESASVINIDVAHDKEIAKVTYTINDEEPVEIDGEGKLEVKKEVELPVGEAKLVITAEDINGVSAAYEKTYNVEQKPTIIAKQEENKINITAESSIKIDYIKYYWDDDEANATTLTINSEKTETLIDAIAGTHTLNIIAVDMEGNETKKTPKVIGDNKPKLTVTTDGENFIIRASDDENLEKIDITLNSNETVTEEINDKEFTKKVPLEDGLNKITVVVYNANNITETVRVKSTKE